MHLSWVEQVVTDLIERHFIGRTLQGSKAAVEIYQLVQHRMFEIIDDQV